jgi:rubrerythrin
MQKYAVVENTSDALDKAAAEGCPRCGSAIERDGSVASCPRCGTEPFEACPEHPPQR